MADLSESPYCSHGYCDISLTFVSWLGRVFCCVLAGLSDFGWFDWCRPGPHEVSLPDECQPHDAEHQLVVHSGAGTR